MRPTASGRSATRRGAVSIALVAGLVASCGGPGYRVVADLGTVLIVVADRSLAGDGLVAAARSACAGRTNCQARVWTDGQWAPKTTEWPPGSRENVALILNRFPSEGGEYHRWNCRRYRTLPQSECIPF
jgi:hypothetical protein